MVSRGSATGVPFALILSIFALAAIATSAAANPIVPGPDFENSSDAIWWLFVHNLPLDMFWFTLVLYFVLRWLGTDAGKISRNSGVFAASVLFGGVLIAFAGAVIDFYSFYDATYQGGFSFWLTRHREFFGSSEFYLALVGIFVSIYIVSVLMVRVNWRVSLVPAAVMTALNPVAWVVIMDDKNISGNILIMVTVVLASISFALLLLWHSRLSEDSINKDDSTRSAKGG